MRSEDLNFYLPPELIAQDPMPNRSASRLLHYKRSDRSIAHRTFSDLPKLLQPDDVMVFNDARVIPARFMLQKDTGGLVEGLFVSEQSIGQWTVLLRNIGDRIGQRLVFTNDPGVTVVVTSKTEGGEYGIRVDTTDPAAVLLDRLGRMPLPPYIRREKGTDERDEADKRRYQTVYSREAGSIAAPTAGLHFTDEVLTQIDARGIDRVHLTLHVGMGTFKPVTADTLQGHTMHTEKYELDAAAAVKLNQAESRGRRIVAVGTTASRVLESYPEKLWEPTSDATSIFIYPPYRWRRVGALITNFHLPKSTLIALVAALVGLDEQRRIYKAAIDEKYRFFSFGDAMLLE